MNMTKSGRKMQENISQSIAALVRPRCQLDGRRLITGRPPLVIKVRPPLGPTTSGIWHVIYGMIIKFSLEYH